VATARDLGPSSPILFQKECRRSKRNIVFEQSIDLKGRSVKKEKIQQDQEEVSHDDSFIRDSGRNITEKFLILNLYPSFCEFFLAKTIYPAGAQNINICLAASEGREYLFYGQQK
jgi:hypothetical protein